MNRHDILERVNDPDDRKLAARVLDKIQLVVKTHIVELTDFYDPYQQNLISSVLSKVPGISFLWEGGYPSAERQRLAICPDYMDAADVDLQLQAVDITGNLKFQSVSHRDYLGAILGLGIKREKMGDLFVTERGCQVIVDQTIVDYIIGNLDKVHRVGVRPAQIPLTELELPEEKAKEISATVPSLRLDAIAAAGFGVSRSKVAGEIRSDRAKVNWNAVTDCSFTVKEGDRITIRGRGRIQVEQIRGETKKGRISLILKRF